MKNYAYATLVMRGDAYVAAALIMGYSLKIISNIDVVCMVTDDVSKRSITLLKKVFDHVIDVPYIRAESIYPVVKTKKQKDRYESWLSGSYTKWNILKLTNYKKIFLLDADTVVIKNIDDVFDFNTPAGVFDTPFSNSFGKAGFHDYYKNVKFGELIPHKSIYNALNNKSNVVWGTAVLLSPNKKDYKDFIKMLKKNQPFGFNSASGNDEQSIAYFYYLKKKKWTQLPNNLNTIAWYSKILKKPQKIPNFCKKKSKKFSKKLCELDKCRLITCQVPHVIHFFGSEMVWNYRNPNRWPDSSIFWQFVQNLLSKKLPNNKKFTKANMIQLKKMYNSALSAKIDKSCFWCDTSDHPIIDKNNMLKCPKIKKCA